MVLINEERRKKEPQDSSLGRVVWLARSVPLSCFVVLGLWSRGRERGRVREKERERERERERNHKPQHNKTRERKSLHSWPPYWKR